jgi:hypothetical protein
MHGSIFLELQNYVGAKLGAGAWSSLLSAAGMNGREFDMLSEYPDADLARLVTTASTSTGTPASVLLEDFGAFIAPDLLEMFWGSIDPQWRTLDVIEHTEDTIHKVVRIKNPGAHPPELKTTRPRPDEVLVEYRSARRLCQVAKGIVRGLALHFGETVVIHETDCMHSGQERCLISVRLER